MTILDRPVPKVPVNVVVELPPPNHGSVSEQKGAKELTLVGSGFEDQMGLVIRATGLVAEDFVTVGVHGIPNRSSVVLTQDRPSVTISFADCEFERNQQLNLTFTLDHKADQASETTVNVTAAQLELLNDDHEMQCSALVFYDFDNPQFLPAGEAFKFQTAATFVLPNSPVPGDGSSFTASEFKHTSSLVQTTGLFKADVGKPVRDDSLAAQSTKWGGAEAYTFAIGTKNDKKVAPAGEIVAIDFWDKVASGGPTEWELRASVDDFKSVFARGETHLGEQFTHNHVLLSTLC